MKSGDEMIRLGGYWILFAAPCNRSRAGVVQNAHRDAKPPPIPFTRFLFLSFFLLSFGLLFWGSWSLEL